MSASLPEPVLAFLRAHALAAAGERPASEPLSGGVSSEIWRVHLRVGTVCVKRALARLRVAQRWEAPLERNRYEWRWLQLAAAAVPGCAPKVLAAGEGLFAMQDLAGLPVWKHELRDGRADPDFARAVGERLVAIHAATAAREEIAREFATGAIFHALRLEPYFEATAARHPRHAPALLALAARTAATRGALVHGDTSPKNILVGHAGPVFLDAECAWYGDPAFDLAFCLNHLLLKCLWKPAHRDRYLACFDALRAGYLAAASWEPRQALEARAASLLPALLLARVDGKSPVEYLDREEQKNAVRAVAAALLAAPPASLSDVKAAWQES